MSITRHHIEWLSLVPNSGPFLSLPVLAQAFPQGLDAHDADQARLLRMAFVEWDDNQTGKRPDPGIHQTWIKLVLAKTLGYDELLAEKQEISETIKSEIAEYGVTLKPDWIVNDPATKKVRLLVQVYPRTQPLTKPVPSSRWNTSPDTRMMQLLHDTGIRLGIVTNGDHWMLVNAPKNETTGYASWYANLWLEEQITLRAFRTLLCADRLFSVPENETLEALLDKSADDQQEVTDQLGYQVRKAVEVLIQSLDKADQDHGRKLLADVDERLLYESALTVMMRLVFLFCAEERELLLLGDDLYDKNYAVSTLREQLRVTADQFGEEILGLRYDAWTRLLTSFRAVYAGAKHDRLKLPAYVGSLFNPDRFPFLEGRKLGTSWKNTEATPLPINNRTVLHLLEALQVLQVRLPGGGAAEARKLSFRALDIEQIGHVYEGLLDHTAKRATEPVLGLSGTRDREPEIALAELEKFAAKGEKELLKLLKDESGRSESALKKGLKAELEDQLLSRFRTACQDSDLWKRVKPLAGLVRLDNLMNHEHHQIGSAAARLADRLPYSVMIAVAGAVALHGSLERAAARQAILQSLPTPDFRDATADFLNLWHSSAGSVGAEAVAVALVTAARCEHDHRHEETVEIVWTGPEPAETRFRQTEQAILEVVNSATRRLTVVSYAVYRIPRIREALVAVANRGVGIRLIVETPNRIEGQGEYDCLMALGDNVASACSVYYWPQENRAKDDNGKIGILHVKCAVADGHQMFLSSANFTEYAFTINMELGLLVTGGKLPERVERHFERLIEVGSFPRV